jgi:hypothetical protein
LRNLSLVLLTKAGNRFQELSRAVAMVPEETSFVIVGSSKCADDILWWPVRTDDGILGWMPEGQNGVYLLEPYP